MNSLFKEKQRFRSAGFKFLFIVLSIIPIVLITMAFDFKEQDTFEENVLNNLDIILFAIIIYALVILLFITKLTIFMNQYGIFINFFPFYRKHIVWFKIKEAKIIDSRSIKGLGINIFTKYGTAFKIKGDKGLHVKLTNGKEYLIATKRASKLEKVVDTYRKVHNF